eukprot:6207460-Pleurochrysis_carterae.AAC.1
MANDVNSASQAAFATRHRLEEPGNSSKAQADGGKDGVEGGTKQWDLSRWRQQETWMPERRAVFVDSDGGQKPLGDLLPSMLRGEYGPLLHERRRLVGSVQDERSAFLPTYGIFLQLLLLTFK